MTFGRLGWSVIAFLVLNGQWLRAGDFDATEATVGRGSDGLYTPVNQIVSPAGKQIELPGVRPNALALSPDANLLVTSGLKQELLVIDPRSGQILQHVAFPPDTNIPARSLPANGETNPYAQPQLSFTGLAFSPDGTRIYLANVNGDIKVFAVRSDRQVAPLFSIALPKPDNPDRKLEIPAGIAVSKDGQRLYVAFNLSNRLIELEASTGRSLRLWAVGVAPFDVALAGQKVYVSNWGGRRAENNQGQKTHYLTGPSGFGGAVRVDSRSIANEGSVSVIDLKTTPDARNPATEIVTGLHASALAIAPGGRWLTVANAGSDTVSVIDTRTDRIVETISVRQDPGDPFGAQPNGLAFDKRGKRLFVCNGTQNSVAVVEFNPGASKLVGLVPAGWFPGGVAFDAKRNQLCVANLKSISATAEKAKLGNGLGFNTRQYAGSLTLAPVPRQAELAALTRRALANLRYPLIAQAKLPPRPDAAPRPVPERVGEPSVFNHVLYIIKENRTYDQVLGDIGGGNGRNDLCIFGGKVTPNQHKLVTNFVLLDNAYCSGILSADGHQWANSALATDYIEREFAGFPRSYPAGGFGREGRDALAYSPAGFLWDNALARGRTICDFGEFTTAQKHWRTGQTNPPPKFLDCYADFMSGSNAIVYSCEPDLESLRPYMMTNTIGWDLDVPDAWRAARFIEGLKAFEAQGQLPNLVILWLPNDHTSATKSGSPTPAAQVADNDLAVGRVIEAVSHGKFWKDTCIFAIEDDPQNGWDHVSGYRTTAYVASPYTRRGTVVSTQYNQTSMIRTMELILGLPPMNQLDATATPMFDCFTNTPDFSAFDAVSNSVPLDEMNPDPKKISDRELRQDARLSAGLPLNAPDRCPEDVLNRILWRAAKGPGVPYPTWAVVKSDED